MTNINSWKRHLRHNQRTSIGLALLLFVATLSSGCAMTSTGMNAEGARLHQQGRDDDAILKFNQAIAANPTNADSYYNLGALYHQMAKGGTNDSYLSQAENYYRMALETNRNHTNAHRGLSVLMIEQKRPEEAFALVEDWANRSPGVSAAQVELARLHREFGDNKAEEQHLLTAVSINPRDARARAALGKIREDQGDLVQAYANYSESLAANRLNAPVAARLAALRPTVNPVQLLPTGGTRTVRGNQPILSPAPIYR